MRKPAARMVICVVEDLSKGAKWRVGEANYRNLDIMGNSGNRGRGGATVGLRHVDKPETAIDDSEGKDGVMMGDTETIVL